MPPPVLIVGAGPVGLTLAGELSRFGVPVRIVDKAAARTDKSKALVVWSRTLELLARAGAAEAFVAAGMKAHGATIVSGATTIARVSFDGVPSPYPFALMLPQSETERLLEAHLAGLGGAVEREVELAGFADHGDGVTATLRRADGGDETVETPWLIGCDGAHSAVRHGLGMVFEGDTLNTDWILADVHITGWCLPEDELGLFWHSDGVLAFFPISPGRWRIIADLGVSRGPLPGDPTLEATQAIVDRRGPGGVRLSDPVWLSTFRINERKVADYRAGRAFLVGDAAHVHSPAGGQGMNTGMQDAFNLAWKLAMVWRGTCPAEPLLGSYSVERGAVGAKVLADAGRLTGLALLRNPLAQAARNVIGGLLLGLTPLKKTMADNLAEVSIGYPASPLNGAWAHRLGGPEPGERVAPVVGVSPVGAGREPLFALMAHPGEEADGLTARHPGLLDPLLRPPPDEHGLWLVRPDGYAAATARVGHAEELDTYLTRLAAGQPPAADEFAEDDTIIN